MKDNEKITMQLLTPLYADFIPDYMEYEDMGEDGIYFSGYDLTAYKDSITEMVNRENSLGREAGSTCNLMDYYHDDDEVKEKVENIEISVKEKEGQLVGCATVVMQKPFLSQKGLVSLCDYIEGQYSDGWGEGFEQREIKVESGTLYVHFWNSKGLPFEMDTQVNREKNQTPDVQQNKTKKPAKNGRER